jgi:hypothetical protein
MDRFAVVRVAALALLTAGTACHSSTEGMSETTVGVSTSSTVESLYPEYDSEVYADPAAWLCRPDIPQNPCLTDLDATIIDRDGRTSVDQFRPGSRPVDCFVVYGKVSNDPEPNADLVPQESEEIATVRNSFAQLSRVCQVYAPVYRQSTALSGPHDDDLTAGRVGAIAYASVLDAWKHYVANDNHDRGVVIVGQSAGSSHLRRLIAEEIDTSPVLRSRLVSAVLIGWAVAVPPGGEVGGSFSKVPACRSTDQTGCVVSFSSFRSTAPPGPASRFGRPKAGPGASLCVNPAAPAGGSTELHPWFHTPEGALANASLLATTGFLDPSSAPPVSTAYVELPGVVTGECVQREGYTYLEITTTPDASGPRVDDVPGDAGPEWGLHLVDANLVLGDLLALIRAQAASFTDGH